MAKGKENRRFALKAFGAGIGTLLVGGSLPDLTRYSEIIPEDAEKLIEVSKLGSILNFEDKESGLQERFRVQVQPEGFLKSLIYIAKREEQNIGVNELTRFLYEKGPLQIVVSDEYELRPFVGKSQTAGSAYTPSYWGGPTITFSRRFMDEYLEVEQAGDIKDKLVTDGLRIIHELYHVVDEYSYPIANTWKGFTFEATVLSQQFGFSDEDKVFEHPLLTEARDRAYEVLLEKIRAKDYYPDGHLEKFFSFTPLG